MIRKLVDFSLENRFLILAAAVLLLVWGAISFHQLPWKLTRTLPTTTSTSSPSGRESPRSKSNSRSVSL